MGKSKGKQRTAWTIIIMTILAIAIIIFYFYWTNRTNPLGGNPDEKLSETQKLIKKDLDLYYPETPREVVKLFGSMMKALYNEREDDEINALALKIRELYDEELLANNPEDKYLKDLYSDLAEWEESDRRISNYLLIDDEEDTKTEIEGVSYTVIRIAFTIQENTKFTETWKVLLRQDENEKWKIVGWGSVPQTEE